MESPSALKICSSLNIGTMIGDHLVTCQSRPACSVNATCLLEMTQLSSAPLEPYHNRPFEWDQKEGAIAKTHLHTSPRSVRTGRRTAHTRLTGIKNDKGHHTMPPDSVGLEACHRCRM